MSGFGRFFALDSTVVIYTIGDFLAGGFLQPRSAQPHPVRQTDRKRELPNFHFASAGKIPELIAFAEFGYSAEFSNAIARRP